jgi:hypothetical protein
VRPIEELVTAVHQAMQLPPPSPTALQRLFALSTTQTERYRSRLCRLHRAKQEARRDVKDEAGALPPVHCAHAMAFALLRVVQEEAKRVGL